VKIPVPYLIRRVDDGRRIEIQWDERGHVALFGGRALRLACQCAGCVEEMTGRPVLDAASVPAEVRALAVKLVGAYAAHFQWSDGHSTGIYPWERLYAACPCAECTTARSTT
jgi:DUF971 family protein